MHLTKPKQALREDLKEAAATLKWAGLDLFAVANRMQSAGDEKGANELMEIARSFQEVDDNLETHSVSQVKHYSNKVVDGMAKSELQKQGRAHCLVGLSRTDLR